MLKQSEKIYFRFTFFDFSSLFYLLLSNLYCIIYFVNRLEGFFIAENVFFGTKKLCILPETCRRFYDFYKHRKYRTYGNYGDFIIVRRPLHSFRRRGYFCQKEISQNRRKAQIRAYHSGEK